jgi:hypothetical protein
MKARRLAASLQDCQRATVTASLATSPRGAAYAERQADEKTDASQGGSSVARRVTKADFRKSAGAGASPLHRGFFRAAGPLKGLVSALVPLTLANSITH